jgi:hypothetical protein
MSVSVVNHLVLAISIAALGTAYRIAVRSCCECILLLLLPRALPRRIHLFRVCLCVRASNICIYIYVHTPCIHACLHAYTTPICVCVRAVCVRLNTPAPSLSLSLALSQPDRLDSLSLILSLSLSLSLSLFRSRIQPGRRQA